MLLNQDLNYRYYVN